MPGRSRSTTQEDLFEIEAERSLLDQLIADARLYTSTKEFQDLMDFVVRLRNFAPFNAMLLQVQKPGLQYAASAADWRERFGRWPKQGARPLLIMWPFGPVALVYDQMDTEGAPLPIDVETFHARGDIDESQFSKFERNLGRKGIELYWFDGGDGKAGSIAVMRRGGSKADPTQYRLSINRNHSPATRFVTVAHELAHLFLGHLGGDKYLNVPLRPRPSHDQREIEAEAVAYLLCRRNGMEARSEAYLRHFVNDQTGDLDIYAIMRAAGQAEAILGLTAKTRFDRPGDEKPLA